jgi:hypothetical protein
VTQYAATTEEAAHHRQAALLARLDHRAQPQHLGVVGAPDRQSAEIIAVEQFKLSDEQRRRLRLVISERRR